MGIADSQTVTECKKMIGKRYRHFKGSIYIVSDIAVCCDTEQTLVVYKSCDNPSLKWVRPLKTFLSEVDHEKYPDVKQVMRFEEMPDEAENEMSMTENEVKETREWLQDFIRMFCCNFDDLETRGFNECVMFLKELEQYRAIGTIEEFKDLKEKSVEKKVIAKKYGDHTFYFCPKCKIVVGNSFTGYIAVYCKCCGQKLDWRSEVQSMAISRMPNGFYSRSDSYFKRMNKQSLINYIRTIEKNWENALITNDIQYENCKRLLIEERNKVIDEFAEMLKEKYEEHNFDLCLRQNDYYSYSNSCMLFESYIDGIAKQLKAGGKKDTIDIVRKGGVE